MYESVVVIPAPRPATEQLGFIWRKHGFDQLEETLQYRFTERAFAVQVRLICT